MCMLETPESNFTGFYTVFKELDNNIHKFSSVFWWKTFSSSPLSLSLSLWLCLLISDCVEALCSPGGLRHQLPCTSQHRHLFLEISGLVCRRYHLSSPLCIEPCPAAQLRWAPAYWAVKHGFLCIQRGKTCLFRLVSWLILKREHLPRSLPVWFLS